MELPIELRLEIESKLEKIDKKNLQEHAQNISLKYRNESGQGKRLLTKQEEAISYAAVRMPATYGAIYTSIKNTLQIYFPEIKTLLDVGSGTGAGSWAASNLLNLDKITCLEREDVMINLGKSLIEVSNDECIKNAQWKQTDLVNENIEDTADLVICSYVLNEMNEKERNSIVQKLWKCAKKILIIIEPGTPVGFDEIKQIRNTLIKQQGHIIAPRPNIEECKIKQNDWCHSTIRVSRTKTHKTLKNANVPYEDEKFSYIAISKEEFTKNEIIRVLRHPKIETGKITLEVCTNQGIHEMIVTKKDKQLFKKARKIKCGDILF